LWREEQSGGGSFFRLGDLFPVLPTFHTRESGEQILEIDDDFDWYLDRVERWFWWIEVDNFTKNGHVLAECLKEAGPVVQILNPSVQPLASTRFGNTIAFMLKYVATSATNVTRVSGRRTTRNNIAGTFGPLVWLPRMTKAPAEGVDLVLDHMLGIGGVEQAPDWLERYRMPQEEAALNQLESLEADMQELEERIRLAEERLRNERRFKKLLYEQGSELEVAVREALEMLGATVHEPENDEDDGRLEDPSGRPAMLEVKGRKGSGSLQEVRQLHDWMDNAYHNEGWEGKGILVANIYNSEDPEARAEPYADNCVRAAECYHQCLITSKQLFDTIKATQEGRADLERFWNSVFETDGVWRSPIAE
jgi:hypothetical protein